MTTKEYFDSLVSSLSKTNKNSIFAGLIPYSCIIAIIMLMTSKMVCGATYSWSYVFFPVVIWGISCIFGVVLILFLWLTFTKKN